MTNTSAIGLWATVSYRDGQKALAWLTALGFIESAVHRNEKDPTVIDHAEMLWPQGGGIMFGTHQVDNAAWPQQPGAAAAYLVTDNPDDLHAAALAAGGTNLEQVADNDYGGRGGSVRDPEGNLWSFGSYSPQ